MTKQMTVQELKKILKGLPNHSKVLFEEIPIKYENGKRFVSEETRKKLSEARRKRLTQPNAGNKHSIESRLKMSASGLGKVRGLNKKHKDTSSKFFGVSKLTYKENGKTYNSFRSLFYEKGRMAHIISNKSELICAYFYNLFIVENNIPNRELNKFTDEEINEIFLLIQQQNLFFDNKRIKENFDNSKISVNMNINQKTIYLGSYSIPFVATTRYNNHIIKNNLSKCFKEFE